MRVVTRVDGLIAALFTHITLKPLFGVAVGTTTTSTTFIVAWPTTSLSMHAQALNDVTQSGYVRHSGNARASPRGTRHAKCSVSCTASREVWYIFVDR